MVLSSGTIRSILLGSSDCVTHSRIMVLSVGMIHFPLLVLFGDLVRSYIMVLSYWMTTKTAAPFYGHGPNVQLDKVLVVQFHIPHDTKLRVGEPKTI